MEKTYMMTVSSIEKERKEKGLRYMEEIVNSVGSIWKFSKNGTNDVHFMNRCDYLTVILSSIFSSSSFFFYMKFHFNSVSSKKI